MTPTPFKQWVHEEAARQGVSVSQLLPIPLHTLYSRRIRALNAAIGLRQDGKPRKPHLNLGVPNKDHAAYMRAWRARHKA